MNKKIISIMIMMMFLLAQNIIAEETPAESFNNEVLESIYNSLGVPSLDDDAKIQKTNTVSLTVIYTPTSKDVLDSSAESGTGTKTKQQTRYFVAKDTFGNDDVGYQKGEIISCKTLQCPTSLSFEHHFIELNSQIIKKLEENKGFYYFDGKTLTFPKTETLKQDWWTGFHNYQTTATTQLSYECTNCDTIGKEIWIATTKTEEFIRNSLNDNDKSKRLIDLDSSITSIQVKIDAESDSDKKADLEAEKAELEKEKKETEDGWGKKIQTRGVTLQTEKNKIVTNTKHVYDKNGNKIADITNEYYELKKLSDGTIQLNINEGGKSTYYYEDGETLELIRDEDGNIIGDNKDFDLSEWVDEVSGDVKESRETFRKAEIDKVMAGPFSLANKLSIMGFWRVAGTVMHSFNAYKGISSLTGLIWDWVSDEEVAKRKQKLQNDFCVIGGLKQCFTSLLCDGIYFKSDSNNYMLVKGPEDEIPLLSASIVGERSDEINFKGETRENLIELLGSKIYINGEFIDFTDPSLDVNELPIKMWLYNVQLNVKNPLNKDLHLNIEFRGPDRRAKWFSGWRVIKKNETETKNKNILKYSTTEYNEVCLIFKEKLPAYPDYEDLWKRFGVGTALSVVSGLGITFPIISVVTAAGDKHPTIEMQNYKSEFCSTLVGAGNPSSIEGNNIDNFSGTTEDEGGSV